MAVQIGNLELTQKAINKHFEEIPLLRQQQQPQQQPQQQQRQQQQHKLTEKLLSPRRSKRRISRQVVMNNLGLFPFVDKKNDRGMSPIHIASSAGNMYVCQFF